MRGNQFKEELHKHKIYNTANTSVNMFSTDVHVLKTDFSLKKKKKKKKMVILITNIEIILTLIRNEKVTNYSVQNSNLLLIG